MRKLSVVIPSRNFANASHCIAAVRELNPGARVIVVWDGDRGFPYFFEECDDSQVIRGEKPFIFARNVNAGIRACEDDDVIVLNDDALLRTKEGFTQMQIIAAMRPWYGVIAATTNVVGNPDQQPQGGHQVRDERRMVCFVAVLIPRRTIDRVGVLDERFVDYGCDDDDYCKRVLNAGMRIGIMDQVFVDHGTLESSYRHHGAGDFRPNLRRFIEKWGVDNWGNTKEESAFADLFE